MIQAALRWVFPLTALLLVGPVAGALTGLLHAPDGSHHTTLFTSDSWPLGLGVGAGVFLLAAAIALPAARAISPGFGLFSAGLVLAWATWGGRGEGTIDQIARSQLALNGQGIGLFPILALEALFVGPLAFLLAYFIIRFARAPRPHPPGSSAPHHLPEPTQLLEKHAPLGLLAGLAVAALIVYLVAQESLKGQCFAAACIAGLAAAAAGRLVAIKVNAAVFVAALALLAAISPMTALAIHGSGDKPILAAQANTLFSMARVLPLDYAAGAFLGVPLGLSWAASMIEHHVVQKH